MKKVRVLVLSALLVASMSACTAKQKAAFICKVKYGPTAHAIVHPNGDADCYRVGGGIHITCQEDMPCWNCKTMGNHICGKKH